MQFLELYRNLTVMGEKDNVLKLRKWYLKINKNMAFAPNSYFIRQ